VPRSIRRSLLQWLLPAFVVMLGVGAVAAYQISLRPALDMYDQALTDDALALASSIRERDGRATLELPPQAEQLLRMDSADHVYLALRGPQGELLVGDPLPAPPARAREGRTLYRDSFLGQRVRVVALNAPCGVQVCVVQVAETTVKREHLRREILLAVFLPATGVATVTLLLVWWGVGKGLQPLTRLSHEIGARSRRDLRPMDEQTVPLEARALVAAINALLTDLASATAAQRRFIADAAHQLRTPLAGIQTQAELALQQPASAALGSILHGLHDATLRTARLAEQLLTLARAEPGARPPGTDAACDLRRLMESNAHEWVRRALAKDIDLGFELEPVSISADALLMSKLIANLVDNALEYTPRAGRITVRCRRQGDSVELEVEDNGPGIEPEERERVLERFYRCAGTPGQGSGLGLAIVNEIATSYGGTVTIAAPTGGGTLVLVRLPAAPRFARTAAPGNS